MITPSDIDLENRQGLAEMLFRGVRIMKEYQDGYAFGYPHEAAWISRLQEFARLEKLAAAEFFFEIQAEPEKNLVWLTWRADLLSIQAEFDHLSPRYNPVGRVTLLKEEPLVSLIVVPGRGDIRKTLQHIQKRVRPPIEIVVLDNHLPADLPELDNVRADLNWQTASNGGIVVFMDADMPVDDIPDMLARIKEYDIVIGVPKDNALTARVLDQAAQSLLDAGIARYSRLFWVVRRMVFNRLPLHENPFVMLEDARKRGMTILEVPANYKIDTSLVSGLRQIVQARLKR